MIIGPIIGVGTNDTIAPKALCQLLQVGQGIQDQLLE